MTKGKAELLLAAVIVARSTSYLLSKNGLGTMDTFNLLAVRFLLAFALLLPLLHKHLRGISRRTLLRGALLGLSFFGVVAAELTGLRTTPTSVTSFLENTAIVLVPLLAAALHRRFPSPVTLLSAGAALLGVGFLSLGGGGFRLSAGELWCLLAALCYAVTILLTDKFSKEEDPLAMGALQVGFLGLYALCASLLWESPRLPQSGGEWGSILLLALVCTGFGFTLQPLAQRHTSAERAGLFCALNPLVAGTLGWLLLRENMGLHSLIGAVLILGGILLSLLYRPKARLQPPPQVSPQTKIA